MKAFLLLTLLFASLANAQNYTLVTASHIQDASGALLPSGQFCVQAVSGGTPFIFQAGGGGIVHTTPACTTVTNGVIASMSVANSALTTPTNVTYVISVTDNSTGNIVLSTAPTQITGASWSFDAYVPTSTPLAVIQSGPTGPQGPPGTASVSTSNGTSGNFLIGANLTVDGSIIQSMTALAARGWLTTTDIGAVGDGTTDDTAKISAALTALASGGGTLIFNYGVAGNYYVSSTVNVPSRVNLISFTSGMSDAGSQIAITGNFAGAILEFNATQGSIVQGLTIKNSYWGGTQGVASALHYDGIVGMVTVRDSRIQANDTAIQGSSAQLITCTFQNVYVVGGAGTDGLSRGYSVSGRNSRILGGRVYDCHVALDIAGDDWKIDSADLEFNDIVMRTGAIAGLLMLNNHIETFGTLWTNSQALPTTTTTPWTDPGGNGTGWAGTIRWLNNTVFGGAFGVTNGQATPLFVLKSQISMSGRLELNGNDYTLVAVATSANFLSVSASFDYTVTPALVSGIQVLNYDAINTPTIPNDPYTAWLDLSKFGWTFLGGYGQAGAITINGISPKQTISAQTAAFSGSSLAVGSCATSTVTISGINRNWAAVASPVYYDPGPNFTVRAVISGDGPTVTVAVCSLVAGSSFGSMAFNVRVMAP